jgi:hypothetical protein
MHLRTLPSSIGTRKTLTDKEIEMSDPKTTKAVAPKLEDVLGSELHRSGSDIPEGSYPGTLYNFGEPFMLASAPQFVKPGQPAERAVFEMQFAIITKDGIQGVQHLVPVPEGGASNRRSNLYKALKMLRGTDPEYFEKDGNFAKGANLKKFVGSTCVVQVKKNAKDFPTVEALASPVDGMKFPTMEECKRLEAELAAADTGDGTIPF